MEEHVRSRSERGLGRRRPHRLGRNLPPRHRPGPLRHGRRRALRLRRSPLRRQSPRRGRERRRRPGRRRPRRVGGESAVGLERRIHGLHHRADRRPARRNEGGAFAGRSDDSPLPHGELGHRPASRTARSGPSLLDRRRRDPALAPADSERRIVAAAPRRHADRQWLDARPQRPRRRLRRSRPERGRRPCRTDDAYLVRRRLDASAGPMLPRLRFRDRIPARHPARRNRALHGGRHPVRLPARGSRPPRPSGRGPGARRQRHGIGRDCRAAARLRNALRFRFGPPLRGGGFVVVSLLPDVSLARPRLRARTGLSRATAPVRRASSVFPKEPTSMPSRPVSSGRRTAAVRPPVRRASPSWISSTAISS